MVERLCKNCEFYDDREAPRESGRSQLAEGYGRCRIRGPVTREGSRGFPIMLGMFDWCGEFKRQIENRDCPSLPELDTT